MAVSYFLNWMGPASLDWYRARGLTRKEKLVVKDSQAYYPIGYKAGHTRDYEQITEGYSCGRIDVRDSRKPGYDGWDEYSVPPMKATSWALLGDWLWDLQTEEVVGYCMLIEMFEQGTQHKIEWYEEPNFYNKKF